MDFMAIVESGDDNLDKPLTGLTQKGLFYGADRELIRVHEWQGVAMRKVIAIGVLLAGCAQGHDDAFYRAHDAERAAKIAECLVLDSMAFQKSPECSAAVLAEPYRPYEYWKANRADRQQWMQLCTSVNMPVQQSNICVSVGKASSAMMGGGTPVYAR